MTKGEWCLQYPGPRPSAVGELWLQLNLTDIIMGENVVCPRVSENQGSDT